MKKSTFGRTAAALALAAAFGASALPSQAQQADFTTYVALGDSLTAGFTDGCWVKHGQIDSYVAIIARQAGAADFQQPLLDEPGVGSGVGAGKGCLVLQSLAPAFTRKVSDPKPLNLTLARPYNNLAVPGYNIHDVTTTKAAVQNSNPLTDLVLRGLGGGTTALQQAASLRPTFVTVFIGNNDVLGAATSGTVIDGVTLTPAAPFTTDINTIAQTLKAAQGGTGKGIFFTVPDVASIPFTSTIPPFIVVGGQPVINPATGAPFTYLSSRNNNSAIAPIPANSLLTLNAAGFLPSGFGIPCAVLNAGGVPATSPLRTNCDKPLPDSAIAAAGIPGVVLYPEEVSLLRSRTAEYNFAIVAAATANGYKVFNVGSYFDDLKANGREFGGMTVTTSFLSGGLFSYDGVHPTSLGYAIFADEIIRFINDNYGNNIPRPNLSPFFFNGNAQSGGYPLSAFPLTPVETIAWGAEIFNSEMWAAQRQFHPLTRSFGLTLGEDAHPITGARVFLDRTD
ncbi:MAG: SGNH/GDSL hydrolase family protein [Thermoanaerobaculia bacterium]